MGVENTHKISRRNFLKKAAALVVVAGVAGRDSIGPPLHVEGLPEDVLSPNDLKKAHVSISQSRETLLFLRKGALDIPVFKDAKEGKIKEVVITLVDNDALTWNALSKAEGDGKFVWEMLHPSPKTWSEEAWLNMKKSDEDSIKYYSDWQKFFTDQLSNPLTEESEKVKIRKAMGEGERMIEKYKEDMEILKGPRNKAIEHYLENGLPGDTRPMGTFYRTEPLVKSLQYYGRSDLIGKVFIYVCVGKSTKPDPSDSYPKPDWFEVSTGEQDKGPYPVQMKNRPDPPAGFVIRHEVSHYNPEGGSRKEYDTDLLALDTIEGAWKKFKETGDSSGYVFVFVNDRGITITKKPEETRAS